MVGGGGGVRVAAALVIVALLVVATAYPLAQGDDGERGLAAFRRSLYGSGSVRRTQNQCTNDVSTEN